MSTKKDPADRNKGQGLTPGADGIDEAVLFFVSGLMDQNAELAGKLELIESVKGLAEETLAEAQKAAEVIKAEAEKGAHKKAREVVSKAEAEAEAAVQEIVAKARERAEAEANDIITEARRRSEAMERKGYQVLREADDKASKIVAEAKRRADDEAEVIRREAEQILAASKKAAESDIGEKHRKTREEETKASKLTEPHTSVSLHGGKEAEKTRSRNSSSHESGKKEPVLYDSDVELAVPPPIAFDQLQRLLGHLRKTSHIKVKDLGGSLNKGVRIRLQLRTRVPLLSILLGFPEVHSVSDKSIGEKGILLDGQGREVRPPKRIAVKMKR